MRSLLLFIALMFPIIIFGDLGAAEKSDLCKWELKQSLKNQRGFDIQVGDIISIDSFENESLVFLGTQKQVNAAGVLEPFVFLLSSLDHKILMLPLTSVDGHMTSEEIPSNPKADRRGVCMVQSFVNCFEILEKKKLKARGIIQNDIEINPSWRKTLFDKVAGILDATSGGNAQVSARDHLLRQFNYQSERTQDLQRLIDHLDKGYPAILDSAIRSAPDQIYQELSVVKSSREISRSVLESSPEQEALGWHSMLIIGRTPFMPEKGWRHLILIDTMHPYPFLIDISRMRTEKSFGSYRLVDMNFRLVR